jgi:hypothetical protein
LAAENTEDDDTDNGQQTDPKPTMNGKLVHVFGQLETDEELQD